MNKYILLFLVLLSYSVSAQNTINNYKYVIVPEKFAFLKQKDQYKLNTLTKALLQDKGFTVYLDNDELPTEIANNKCTALVADLIEKNSMFSTNITLLLKDCYGKTVFETKQGKSREKEYNVSYNLALRDAFSSLSDTPYAYQPASAATAAVPVSASTNAAAASAAVSANTTPAAATTSPATATTVSAAVTPPAASTAVPAGTASANAAESKLAAGTLYAQPTANGYQLIDTAPKIILTLYKTSAENQFIASNGTANGIVFKKNDNWIFEYYAGGKLVTEKLQIKF